MNYTLGALNDITQVDITEKVVNDNTLEISKDMIKNVGEVISDIVPVSNFYDILKQLFKYLIEGFVVAIAGYYIPSNKPNINEILMIAFVAAATFAILEMYMPDAYLAARLGFGFQTGKQLITKL